MGERCGAARSLTGRGVGPLCAAQGAARVKVSRRTVLAGWR
jgi:hypothetical protein